FAAAQASPCVIAAQRHSFQLCHTCAMAHTFSLCYSFAVAQASTLGYSCAVTQPSARIHAFAVTQPSARIHSCAVTQPSARIHSSAVAPSAWVIPAQPASACVTPVHWHRTSVVSLLCSGTGLQPVSVSLVNGEAIQQTRPAGAH